MYFIYTKNCPHDFTSSGTYQTEETKNLSFSKRETYICKFITAQMFHTKKLFARLLAFNIIYVNHGSSNHLGNQIVLIHLFNILCFHIASIFHNGYAVTDLHNFFQSVGNIDYADTTFFQFSDIFK